MDARDGLVGYVSGDAMMLKTLNNPLAVEFEASLDEAKEWASSVGYKESDVYDVIQSARKKDSE